MKTLEFEARRAVAIENEDIDVLLVPKEHMKDFRQTELFNRFWACISDKTKFVYC